MTTRYDDSSVHKLETVSLRILTIAALASGLLATSPAYAQFKHKRPPDLEVRVFDSIKEVALEQVKVDLMRLSSIVQAGFTDGTGTVRFPSVEPGTYTIRAFKDGYSKEELSVEVSPGETVVPISVPMGHDAAERVRIDVVSAKRMSLPRAAGKELDRGLDELNRKRNPTASIKHFQKVIAIVPDYYETYFLMGMAYGQLNSRSEAEGALRRAIALNSKFLSPYLPLAMLLFGQKRYDEEDRLLRQAMDQDPQGWLWPFELARCEAHRGQWYTAIEYGQMASQKPDAPSRVHLLMGDLYSNTGNPGKAIAELEEFAKTDPNSPFMPKVRRALAMLREQASKPGTQMVAQP